jgi:CopG family transcriptional regulator/antitoxin EndoAI
MTERPSQTFTISLPPELAAEVDRVAAMENRSRSELLREAFRQYVQKRQRWERIFAFGEAKARELGIESEDDVNRILAEYKREKRERRAAAG